MATILNSDKVQTVLDRYKNTRDETWMTVEEFDVLLHLIVYKAWENTRIRANYVLMSLWAFVALVHLWKTTNKLPEGFDFETEIKKKFKVNEL